MKISISSLKKNSLYRNSFWALFGNGLGYGLLLLSGILIARFLGKDLYGEYGIVKTTMFHIAAFSTFGLGYTSTKFVSDFNVNNKDDVYPIIKSSLNITILSSSLLALLIVAFAHPLASFLGEPSLKLAFQFLGCIVVLKALITTQNGILAGLKDFKHIAMTCVTSGGVMLCTSVPLTIYFGLKGSLASLAISQLCNVLFNSYVLRNHIKTNLRKTKKPYIKKLFKFSIPVAMQELTYALSNWIAPLLLVRYSTVGEMGLYSASAQWNAIITFIPGLLYNVVLSYLSSSVRDTNSHNNTVKRMLLVNFIASFIPFIIVYAFADWISTFYGSSFQQMAVVLRILTFSTIFSVCSNVFSSEFIALGRTWTLFFVRSFRDIFFIVLVFTLLYNSNGNNGAVYFSICTVCSSLLFFIIQAILAYSLIYKKNR